LYRHSPDGLGRQFISLGLSDCMSSEAVPDLELFHQ
jgi:hypothetical protein